VELEITLEIIVAVDFLMNDAKYIGYAEIGIADTMSSSGLCRIDPKTIVPPENPILGECL
jgi:hypothetical protein